MSNNRYYYYDHETCSFVEVKPKRAARWPYVGALVLALVLGGAFFLIMDRTGVGTPEELALKAENEVLQQQLAQMVRRLDRFSTELDALADNDQTLYRKLLQAEPIDAQVRRGGVGGADPYERFNRYSTSSARLLRLTSQRLDQVEQRMRVQNASYRELMALAEDRDAWMVQMPAIMPTSGRVISGYGIRRHPLLKVSKMHHGIDIVADIGTPVMATGDGVVKAIGRQSGYGIRVEIEHPAAGYTTLYAHLSRAVPGLKVGQQVKRGQLIAYSGNTGRTSGPHVHYEVRDREGSSLNPVYFFAPTMTPQQYQALLAASESSTVSFD